MYHIKLSQDGESVYAKESEAEVYDAALYLAQQHLGTVFYIYHNKELKSQFMCVDKAPPFIWRDTAIRLLNGGPLKDSLSKVILDQLDHDRVHWSEVH